MQGIGIRVAMGAFVAIALAGCTTGLGGGDSSKGNSAVEPTFKLDGVYKFVEDGTGTRNGQAIDTLFKGETQWAFRTACDENGCTATGGKFDPANPSAPPQSGVLVADYVDGKWSQVSLAEGGASCTRDSGETFQSNQWSIWEITDASDGNLFIKGTTAGTDECNFINETTTAMTRVGDLPAELKLPDPTEAPARVPSYPANSFRGKYTVDYVLQGNGQSQDSEHMDVKTYCLRSEDRCVTTTINVDPRDPGTPYSLQVYEFGYDKFKFSQTIGKRPCQDGKEGLASKRVILPLPAAPVPDPLDTLTGNLSLTLAGDCTGIANYDAKFTRTGD